MFDGADCFTTLDAFTHVLIKMVLTIPLSTLAAFLNMLVTIVPLVPADNALQSMVGSNRTLARCTCNVLLIAATDLSTGFTGPAMLLTD